MQTKLCKEGVKEEICQESLGLGWLIPIWRGWVSVGHTRQLKCFPLKLICHNAVKSLITLKSKYSKGIKGNLLREGET